MTGDDLPDEDHVVHYVKPGGVFEDGTINGSVFQLRAKRLDETGVSVNWLEWFRELNKADQLAEIRRLARVDLRKNGRFAELNVGAVKAHVRGRVPRIAIQHVPLDAEEGFEANPAHSEITGLPPGNTEEAELVGDMIAECVSGIYPAKTE